MATQEQAASRAGPAAAVCKPGAYYRRYRSRRRLVNGWPLVLPLADIAFIFVIMLLFKEPYVKQPGMVVSLPTGAIDAHGTRYGPLVVTVTREGMVFFNDQSMPMDGLPSAFSQAAHEFPDLPLVVESDVEIPYGTIMEIMNMALAAGIREVNLATDLPGTRP